VSLKIGLHFAVTLRLTAKGLSGMDKRVVIDLNEGFELHPETLAVSQNSMMVIGNPPGTGI